MILNSNKTQILNDGCHGKKVIFKEFGKAPISAEA